MSYGGRGLIQLEAYGYQDMYLTNDNYYYNWYQDLNKINNQDIENCINYYNSKNNKISLKKLCYLLIIEIKNNKISFEKLCKLFIIKNQINKFENHINGFERHIRLSLYYLL